MSLRDSREDERDSAAAADKMQVVTVVGRPNVGKSSLVNRIVGRRAAIVEESPGVTRDRRALQADWNGRRFTVVDTGGWLKSGGLMDRKVSEQAERAIREADLVIFVVDTTVGSTDEDEAVARVLQRAKCPVLLVANKVDSDAQEPEAWDFARLGLGDPRIVSALHGRRMGDLLDEVVGLLERTPAHQAPAPGGGTVAVVERPHEDTPGVALVGRPNVGKSTLFNRLVGDDRSITHELPGTTRDIVDTVIETEAGSLRLIDTAGMRRRSRIDQNAEYYSLVRALEAVDEADVTLLLIDAVDGVTHQDQRLGERIDAAGSPVVILLNKWDLVDAETRERVLEDVQDRLGFLAYSPVLKVSALTGKGVHRILPAVSEAFDAYHRRLPTREVNKVVQAAQAAHAAPGARILYAVQGAVDPPTFTLFTNRSLAPSYLRYIERMLREHFGLGSTPIKLRVRRRAK